MVQTTGQQLVNNLCLINGISDVPKFVMADDSGLETARAQRDSILAPLLKISGLQLNKEYYLRNYDYTEKDIEEGIAPTVRESINEPVAEQIGDKSAVHDTGEPQPAVKDRSVVDE